MRSRFASPEIWHKTSKTEAAPESAETRKKKRVSGDEPKLPVAKVEELRLERILKTYDHSE